MTMQYFNKADCVIFAYDCTSEETFNSMRHWVRQFDQHTKGRLDIEKILVGNKCDMTDEKLIEAEQGLELAKEFGMHFFETSAKTGHNVQEAFIYLAQKVKEKRERNAVLNPPTEQNNNNAAPIKIGGEDAGAKGKVKGGKKKGGCC